MIRCDGVGVFVVPRPLWDLCAVAATCDLTTGQDGDGATVSMEANCDATSALLRGPLG